MTLRRDGFPMLVAEFFARRPDEWLTADDVALKFDVERCSVHHRLTRAVKTGMLSREGSTYRAGPRLRKEIGGIDAVHRRVVA